MTMTTQEKWAVYSRTENASWVLNDASAHHDLFTENERNALKKAAAALSRALDASKRRLRKEGCA